MDTQRRFLSLEAGRGIAALIVVSRHVCVHAFEGAKPVLFVPLPSATAVLFFFVLSGTVMALTHWPERLDLRGGGRFLVRRLARVYPLYWIVLAVTLLEWPFKLVPGSPVATWVFLIPHALPFPALLSMMVIPQAWTLLWEVFFYAVFAVSVALGSRRIFWLWLAFIVVANFWSAAPFSGTLIGLFADRLGLLFLAGVALAGVVRRVTPTPRRSAFALLLGIPLTCLSIWQGSFGLWPPNTLFEATVAAAGISLTLLGLIGFETIGWLRLGRGAAILGAISYPLYVTHWLLMDLTYQTFAYLGVDLSRTPFRHAALLLVVSLVGGVAATVLIDQPLQRLLRAHVFGQRRRVAMG